MLSERLQPAQRLPLRRAIQRLGAGVRGFTLVELILVVGISVLLTTVLSAVVIRLFNDVPRDRANLTASAEMRWVVESISSDVRSAAALQVGASGTSLTLTHQPDASTTVAVTYQVSGTDLNRVEATNATVTGTRVVAGDVEGISFQYTTSTARVTGSITLEPEHDPRARVSKTWVVMPRVTQ